MSSFLDLSLLLDTLRGPTGYPLLLALLHFIWQGFAIAVVIGGALRLMRRRRAQFRYLIGLIGLAAMAVTPVVSAFWIEPPAARAPDVFVAPPEAPRGLLADPEAISLEVDRVEALLLLLESSLEQAPAGLETAGVVPVELRKSVSERLQFWQPYLLFVWLLGMSLFALRLAIGARAAWRYRWGAEPLPAGAYELLLQVSKRLGVLPPRVLVSERVVEAVALGLFRPVILLPAAWMLRIPTEQLEAVLAHEIAHLRRHDLWINFAQRVLEALLFYHPAVWWLSRRVRLEREYCCDEIAAHSLNDRAAYARALEFVAAERLLASRLGKLDTALAATMGDNEMALLNRVRKVLGGEPLPSRRRWRWATGAVLVAPLALWSIVLAGELLWATTEKPPVEAPRVVDETSDDPAGDLFGDVDAEASPNPSPPEAITFGSSSSAAPPSADAFESLNAFGNPDSPLAAVDVGGIGESPHDVFNREKSSDEPFGMPETAEDAFGPPAQPDPKDTEIERLKRENEELRAKLRSAADGANGGIGAQGTVDAEMLRQIHDAYASQLAGLEKLLGSRSSATAQDKQIRNLLAAQERIGKKVDEIIAEANEETKSAAEAISPEDGNKRTVEPAQTNPPSPNPHLEQLRKEYEQLLERQIEELERLGKAYRGNPVPGKDPHDLDRQRLEAIEKLLELRGSKSSSASRSADEKLIDPPPAPLEGDSLSVTLREGGKFVDVAYFDKTLNAEARVSTTPDQLPALLERIAPRLGHADDVSPADNGFSSPLGNPPASYPVPSPDYRSPSDPLVPVPDSPFETEP